MQFVPSRAIADVAVDEVQRRRRLCAGGRYAHQRASQDARPARGSDQSLSDQPGRTINPTTRTAKGKLEAGREAVEKTIDGFKGLTELVVQLGERMAGFASAINQVQTVSSNNSPAGIRATSYFFVDQARPPTWKLPPPDEPSDKPTGMPNQEKQPAASLLNRQYAPLAIPVRCLVNQVAAAGGKACGPFSQARSSGIVMASRSPGGQLLRIVDPLAQQLQPLITSIASRSKTYS